MLGALAKAGRMYAGKLSVDPVQYSCQRNFTILSSDGYWNSVSDTYGPTKEDGATKVGDQDSAASVARLGNPGRDRGPGPATARRPGRPAPLRDRPGPIPRPAKPLPRSLLPLLLPPSTKS